MNEKTSVSEQVLSALLNLLAGTVNTKLGLGFLFIFSGICFVLAKILVETNPVELIWIGFGLICLGVLLFIKKILEIRSKR